MTDAPLWTISEAIAYFTEAGAPMEAWRLRKLIHATGLTPAGRGPSGPKGGRGESLYDAGALQRIHAKNYPLLVEFGPGV